MKKLSKPVFDSVEALAELAEKYQLHSLEVIEDGLTIKLQRGHVHVPIAAPVASTAGASNGGTPVKTSEPSQVPKEKQIRSPFVGTFYSAASPEADAFVKVGQKIRKGDTLCIIEAMKILNELEADRDGVVKEICVKNGQPLEYDHLLFTLE